VEASSARARISLVLARSSGVAPRIVRKYVSSSRPSSEACKLACSQMSSKYSRMAMDCLTNVPLLMARMGTVPDGFPGATNSIEVSVAETVTGVILKLNVWH